MQAILCDVCETALQGAAYEWQILRRQIVRVDEGQPRMTRARQMQMKLVCNQCSSWLLQAWQHLEQAHRATAG